MSTDPRWSAQELRAELNRYEEELRGAGRARNTINTYVQHPERFINWLEGRYRPLQTGRSWDPGSTGAPGSVHGLDRVSAGSSRYDPLRTYLAERNDPVIRLSFVEIEQIIGGPLPESARRHRPWWANDQSGSHVHASSWMGAARRSANVDLNAGTVDFVR
jgi:hypothetical protein